MKNSILTIILYLGIGFRFLKFLILTKLHAVDNGFYFDSVLHFNNTYCKIVPTFSNVLFYEVNGQRFYTKEPFYLNRNLTDIYTLKIFGIKNVIVHKIDFAALEQQYELDAKFVQKKPENVLIQTDVLFYPFSIFRINKINKILNEVIYKEHNVQVDSSSKIKNHHIQINQSKFKIDQFL